MIIYAALNTENPAGNVLEVYCAALATKCWVLLVKAGKY